MLTHNELIELLDYEQCTGLFRWKFSRWPVTTAGQVAGGQQNNQYVIISINKKRYLAHRLAWFYVYGRWPVMHLDHINGDRTDNRIANLRECSRVQNQCNRPTPKNNTSGVKGVYWEGRSKKWRAVVVFNKKKKHVGMFANLFDAEMAVKKARDSLHAEFSNHGASSL